MMKQMHENTENVIHVVTACAGRAFSSVREACAKKRVEICSRNLHALHIRTCYEWTR